MTAAAELDEAGNTLPPALAQALFHVGSMGGARPKTWVTAEDRNLIAK